MTTDLRIMFRLARLIERTKWGAKSGAMNMIRDLHAVTFQELNPAVEAWRQSRFRENIHAFGDNKMITAPEVYRSEEHTSELQSLMRISYAVFCLKKKNKTNKQQQTI